MKSVGAVVGGVCLCLLAGCVGNRVPTETEAWPIEIPAASPEDGRRVVDELASRESQRRLVVEVVEHADSSFGRLAETNGVEALRQKKFQETLEGWRRQMGRSGIDFFEGTRPGSDFRIDIEFSVGTREDNKGLPEPVVSIGDAVLIDQATKRQITSKKDLSPKWSSFVDVLRSGERFGDWEDYFFAALRSGISLVEETRGAGRYARIKYGLVARRFRNNEVVPFFTHVTGKDEKQEETRIGYGLVVMRTDDGAWLEMYNYQKTRVCMGHYVR